MSRAERPRANLQARSDDVPATTMPDTRIRPGIDARAIIIIPSLS
jgi:hypothetical protein